MIISLCIKQNKSNQAMESKASTTRRRCKPNHLDSYGLLARNGFVQVARSIAKNLSPTKPTPSKSTSLLAEESTDIVYVAWSGFEDIKEEEEIVSWYCELAFQLFYFP
jgi:hypothetical protein